MRHLHLFRHAKASWELAGELDYERGLTERGVTDAQLMSEAIEAIDPPPDLVICSGARRARETLEAVAQGLPPEAEVRFDDRLYDRFEANSPTLLEVLRETPDACTSVLVVGHNPVLHDLAVELAADGEELQALAGKFPTAALASLEFDLPWQRLAGSTARLTAFTRPAQLRADD
jgi:phosphohistidine phosphatase